MPCPGASGRDGSCYNSVMAAARTVADQRAAMVEVAVRMLETNGPESLQARKVTAELGTSTQAVYTLFGGMPALFDALVARGYAEFAREIAAVPDTDDPVADFLARGWTYCEWALRHPQWYRLMMGLTAGMALRSQLHVAGGIPRANFPEGEAAVDVLVRSMTRVVDSGRIDPVDPVVAAGQFLSATHGYVLLEIAGSFGEPGAGRHVLALLAVNLMVGLGDARDAARRSLQSAADRHQAQPHG